MAVLSDPKHFFHFIQLLGKFIGIWPAKKDSSKSQIYIYEVRWWITFISVTSLAVPLLLGVYNYRDDSIKMTKSLAEFSALSEMVICLIHYRVQRESVQTILNEIEMFIRKSTPYEEKLMQKYINKYKYFQIYSVFSFLSCSIAFSFIPVLTSQLFPTNTWYPFSVESHSMRVLVYATQLMALYQTGFGISVDLIVAMMFWYSSVQVELLERNVTKAVGIRELKICARRHQQIIKFTNKFKEYIKWIILKSNANMLLVIVCGCIQLIKRQPLQVVLPFMVLVAAGIVRLFVSVWPADDLKEKSENLALSICETTLRQKSSSALKIGLLMALRCQRPMILSVNGVFKAYTLQYYVSFLSTCLQLFFSFRAILGD